MSRLSWHRTRRAFLIAAGVPLALAAAGALYQSIATRREARRFPPPGQLVDVGGRRLHVICSGEGEPVVIFESSAFGNALSASKARAEIAAKTRVCSYDRMGTGWSDPGPPEISVGMLADDLGQLAERAGIRPPFVLVPASIGGLTVELFARRHPERVAGMVFVDAASSAGVERLLPNVTWLRTRAVCLAPLAARVGLLRAIDPFDLRQTGGEAEARAVALMYRAEPMSTICGMVKGVRVTAQEFRAASPLRSDVPLTVLSAETNVGLLPRGFGAGGLLSAAERYQVHQALAHQSSRGRWQMVPGSTHLIGNSQPHALAMAVLEMIMAIRGGAPAAGSL